MKEKNDNRATDSLLKYKQYALDVQSGKITANRYIKQATKRYLDWFERDDLIFRPEKADAVINFISKLKHYSGRFNRKPFILLPYQKWMIYSIFGWYYKDNKEKRVCSKIYIELSRKQGKTAFLSAISLFCLLETPAAECYMVANNAKQAKICFDMSSNFLSSIDPKGKFFERYRDSIKFNATKSKIQVLSNNSSGNDGYSPSFFVLDEAHEQVDSKAWDVMISGQGARFNDNCLAAIITTAGFNKYAFCYEYRTTCLDILAGLKSDDSQFIAIYTQDEDDDIFNDEECWIKSNPSLGVTVSKEYLREQVKNAQNNTSLLTGVLTKNFNKWVDTQDTWITHDELLACSESFDLSMFDSDETLCTLGVDLAAVSDLTAVSALVYHDDKYYFKTWYFIPETCLNPSNSNCELYRRWKREGYLIVTNGNVTDYDYILQLLGDFPLTISSIAYDQYNATQFVISGQSLFGLNFEPYAQSIFNFNRPTREFERLLKSGKVVLDYNPITLWCFSNCVLKHEPSCDNVKPIKSGSGKSENKSGKIDGVISILESLGRFLENPILDTSI